MARGKITETSRLGPAVPASRDDYEAALARLRQQNIVDVDALREAETQDVLAEPLGPTEHCLSADQIAAYVETGETSAASRAHWLPVEEHLERCTECASNVDLYLAIGARQSARTLEPSVRIYAEEPIRICVDPAVSFAVHLEAPASDAVDSATVTLRGCVFAKCSQVTTQTMNTPSGDLDILVAKFDPPELLRPDPAQGKDLEWTEVVDWIQIDGKTIAGRPFSARSLVILSKKDTD